MNKTYKYALSAVCAAMLVTPAFAQREGYSDVPENHWAYEALVRLKREGLLVGYPDGEFKGRRLTTRYELASAIYAVYMNLKGVTDSLQEQINTVKGGGTGENPADLDAIRQQLSQLQSDVNQLKGYGDEIKTLRDLTNSFQKELQSLGVDVEAMKKDIADLQGRVTRLEKVRPSVEFSGDANLFVSAGFTEHGNVGVNTDGKVLGFSAAGPNAAGIEDLSVIHDLGLNFKGTNETGPQFKGTAVIGNGYASASGTGFGNQSDYALGTVNTQYNEGDTSIFLQNLEVSFPTKFAGLGVAARVGRLGYKVSPMILQRPDVTTFYKNDRWDNGLYALDGAELGVDFGGGKFTAIVARSGNHETTNAGSQFQNVLVGGEQDSFLAYQGVGNVNNTPLVAERIMGVNFATGFGNGDGSINASYLLLDGDNYSSFIPGPGGGPVNRAEIFGGDVSYGFKKFVVGAAYGQVNYDDGSHRSLDDGNNAYYSANVKFTGNNFGLSGGYRHIEAQYQAPGDWGRYGLIRNPTNVKGYNVGASASLTGALSLNASYEDLEQIIAGDGDIKKFSVNLNYDLPANVKLFGGYEDTRFEDFNAGGTPQYRFATAGVGYNFSTGSTFTFQYQYGDVENDFVIGNARGTGGTFRGSFFSSQLSVKF